MPQLIRPQKIIVKDGEITVNLVIDLNIHVSGGTVSVPPAEEKTDWEVPTFGPADKVNFGKKGGQ